MIIDTDVHPAFASLTELLPWMDPAVRSYVTEGGAVLPIGNWFNVHGHLRGDAAPPNGGLPGTDVELMREQLLDALDLEYAILSVDYAWSASAMAHPQLAAGIVTAANRWLIDTWLPLDKRFKGSVLVAIQDPERAAEEIRSFGPHPDIVQVLVPGASPTGYGDPRYRPIFEAAVEIGLPVTSHVAGEGAGINPAPTPIGYPFYYIEWHTLLPLCTMAQIVSLVCHGVFEALPELKFGMLECGLTWLPGLAWRLDDRWKALRKEVPWVKQLPSETIRQHLFFGTQPLDEPRLGQQLRSVLEAFDGFGNMIMFASDYPHWDTDSPELVLDRLPAEWRDAVASENARTFYNLPPSPAGDGAVTGSARAGPNIA